MGRDLLHVLSWCALLAAALILAVSNVFWHFQYPDATETRLFLMFWREFVGLILTILISAVILRLTER